ncbi:MAG: leucine-rich repeat domain-containing protein [Oscillospiraceae bacterium]|nr:leucine-rich repeat domain-containing protein [Oscillospiraceae bacterium]
MRKKRKKRDIRKLIRSGITLIVIAAIAAGVYLAAPIVVSKYRANEAARAVTDERPERAIEMLLPELDRNPKDTELRLKLVDLYVETGNYSRAEYLLLRGTLEKAGQIELYRRLCNVFVKQDKLFDAVSLINDMSNPNIREMLMSERPPMPVFNPSPGDYREFLTVAVSVREGDICYLSLNGEIPVLAEEYNEPITLTQGITNIKAVAVSPEGIVSDWVDISYRLDDVIEPVVFEDAVIERITREILGIPNGIIISDKLQAVKELSIPENENYVTLNDLRHFTHLDTLKLVGNGTPVDISALWNLSRLRIMSLTDFGIDSFNLESVGQLEWLEHLDLSRNNIVSLEALSGLVSLKTLVISGNNILDISPLAELVLLERLDFSQNAAESTGALSEMTNLRILNMSGNLISSLKGLEALRGLVTLDMSSNSVAGKEMTYLAGLSSLKELNISGNRGLEDISALGNLSKLEALTADNCSIKDLTELGGLSSLTFLSLNYNAIELLDGLEELESLNILWANRNEINSLRAVSLLPLIELHIEHNKLPSLVRIKDNETLKKVYAFGNPLTETVVFREGVEVFTGR